jgi:hypothetical protein
MDARIKVLCITGSGRSGSTILDTILGQVEGFFSCGELRNLWDNGLKARRLCGCGVALPECPVWKRVVESAFGSLAESDLDRTIAIREQSQSLRSRLTMAIPAGRGRLRASPVRGYLDCLEKLYTSIAATTGCRVIVDSSKLPSHTALLQMLPSIDVYVVHLLRDPRAVAYSWLRKKARQDAGGIMHMPQFSPARTALQWNVRALSTAALCRRQRAQSLTLSYEDFIRDPREATRRIVALTGETAALPFVDSSHARLGMTHTVWGNPGRFQSGTVEISMDDEWQRKMTRKDRAVVTAMTWPLLAYYGYLGNGSAAGRT